MTALMDLLLEPQSDQVVLFSITMAGVHHKIMLVQQDLIIADQVDLITMVVHQIMELISTQVTLDQEVGVHTETRKPPDKLSSDLESLTMERSTIMSKK